MVQNIIKMLPKAVQKAPVQVQIVVLSNLVIYAAYALEVLRGRMELDVQPLVVSLAVMAVGLAFIWSVSPSVFATVVVWIFSIFPAVGAVFSLLLPRA